MLEVIFFAPLLWVVGVGGLVGYSDYANTPVEAGDIHTKPVYEPILTVVGAPALKGLGAVGDEPFVVQLLLERLGKALIVNSQVIY